MDRYRTIVREIKAATYRLIEEQCAGLAPEERTVARWCVAAITLFEAMKGLPPDERATALADLLHKHEIVLGMFDRGEL